MWIYIAGVAGFIVIMVVGFGLYFVYRRLKATEPNQESPYSVKFFLLPKNDRLMYETLLKYANDHGMAVFPRMRLTDFLWTPRHNRNAFLNIQNKFVDFLFVDRDRLKPIAAVFIRDESIRAKVTSEELIRNACESAGLAFVELERDMNEKAVLKKLDSILGGDLRND